MGLPPMSPTSDFFQGTMYMTFGCSRSPVTVAAPIASRSTALGALGAALAGAWAAAGAAGAAGWEVFARGSPASAWASVFTGLVTVVLAAGAGACTAAGGAGRCAAAMPMAGEHTMGELKILAYP